MALADSKTERETQLLKGCFPKEDRLDFVDYDDVSYLGMDDNIHTMTFYLSFSFFIKNKLGSEHIF